jgi:hypothetical protein
MFEGAKHPTLPRYCKLSISPSPLPEDCTDDFQEVHSPTAWAMLAAFQIGVLDKPNMGERRAQIRSWEELQRAGLV